MSELLDERLLIIFMRSFEDYLTQDLGIEATIEAYGPTRNEGLCYESCNMIHFDGVISGALYLGFDGYTRLKILPLLVSHYRDQLTGRVDAKAIISRAVSVFFEAIQIEMLEADLGWQMVSSIECDHKIMPLDMNRYRNYSVIFFLKHIKKKTYLGRAYMNLSVQKINPGEQDS